MRQVIFIERKPDGTGFHLGVEGFTPEEAIAALRMMEGGILAQCFKPKSAIVPAVALPPNMKP